MVESAFVLVNGLQVAYQYDDDDAKSTAIRRMFRFRSSILMTDERHSKQSTLDAPAAVVVVVTAVKTADSMIDVLAVECGE